MLKQELRSKFQEDWEKYYFLEVFKEQGFERKQCVKCGKWFWTADSNRTTCGDSSCENYSFIGRKLKDWDYLKSWQEYEKFFKSKGHESIKRYPTVCRWIPNLNFTIASIVDFQRIEKGRVVFEFPCQNLVVPQFCLRFNDIANVGVTGRHFTGFMMPGQHSYDDYWSDECIRLNLEFLTKVVGVKKEDITYVEDAWTMPDKSVFGPALETFSNGLEIVTNVFMQYYSVNGEEKELEKKVIDVGWGLERINWFVNGSPTAYDSTFSYLSKKVDYDEKLMHDYAVISGRLDIEEGRVEEKKRKIAAELGLTIEELEHELSPIHAIHAVFDHSRSLLFAISDGMLPSNTGGGYNLRVILRRSLGLIEKYSLQTDLYELVEKHAYYLKSLYPELVESLEDVKKILEYEEKKYKESVVNTRRIVEAIVKKQEAVTLDDLKKLYEERGITPEMIQEAAEKQGINVKMPSPEEFYDFISRQKKEEKKKEEKAWIDVTGVPDTEKLYYSNGLEFKAYVLKAFDHEGRHYVILDKTGFYPESGGQDYDTGFLNNVKVLSVHKIGGVIIHEVEKPLFKQGMLVHGRVDAERRKKLTVHHTATHVVNYAARKVLGNHVWQAGAEKKVDKARLDITHYDNITEEEFKLIEEEANKVVQAGVPVIKEEMPRVEAEKKYGFRIYQGGAVPSSVLRIVAVDDLDVEACGGTHVDNTKEIEAIKLLKAKKIKDGVVRIEFVAGKDNVEKALKELEKELEEKKKALEKKIKELDPEALVEGKSIEELEELLKQKIKEKKKKAKQEAKSMSLEEEVVFFEKPDMRVIQEAGRAKVKQDPSSFVVVIAPGMVYGIRGVECSVDVQRLVMKAAEVMGGKAGIKPGKPGLGIGEEFKGGGPLKEKSRQAFEEVKKMLGKN